MSSPNLKSFTAVLEPAGTKLRWVIARIPFDVTKVWPERKGLRVRGEIACLNGINKSSKSKGGGFAFRTALFPDPRGEGKVLVVNRKMQVEAKAGVGEKVRIWLEPDLEERPAEVPPELAAALMEDRSLRRWFDGLSYYMRRMMGAMVSEAKSAEARERMAARIAEWLMLAMEGENELPPILKAAFLRQPLAGKGWEAMTETQRRNHLLGIFHYQSGKSRETRTAQAVEDALRVAKRNGHGAD
ncbi:MAG: YdeI/OmpD-associated family protein [Terracidiphilus sp.]